MREVHARPTRGFAGREELGHDAGALRRVPRPREHLASERHEIVPPLELHLLDRLFRVLAAGDLVEDGRVPLADLLRREEVPAALERAKDVRLGALPRSTDERPHVCSPDSTGLLLRGAVVAEPRGLKAAQGLVPVTRVETREMTVSVDPSDGHESAIRRVTKMVISDFGGKISMRFIARFITCKQYRICPLRISQLSECKAM